MKNLDNIIKKLINQHRDLQKKVNDIILLTKNNLMDIDNIDILLKNFKDNFLKHLKLENKVFYPNLLILMKSKNINILKTQEFIIEINEIEDIIFDFLESYKNKTDIKEKFNKFKVGILNLNSTLNLRIELEESGVYSYWELYK